MLDILTIFGLIVVPFIVIVIYYISKRGPYRDTVDTGNEPKAITLAEFIRRKVGSQQVLAHKNVNVLTQDTSLNEKRLQVREVIAQQAIAGAAWQEISKGPAQVYQISKEEIESEIRRRHRSV
jgi:hypothetical protein